MKIVILAGGVGTRLWPMSSKKKPKQFQNLVSDKSMLQETFERVSFVDPSDIYIATNAEYIDLVKEQLPQVPEENLIGEPSMQDTAPCIGLAAALIAKKDPEAVMASISADHLIQNTDEFEAKLKEAEALAKAENTLNIIEVPAKAPLTNLGYVEVGEEVSPNVFKLKGFKEKPDLETAKAFLASGNYLWNTGTYVWKVSRILKEIEKHIPETYKHLIAIQNGESIEEHYPLCEKISIDYGIMEKVDPNDVRLLSADLGWSDIGTWASLHEELSSPEENLIKGDVTAVECKGCVLYNISDRPMAVFGLNDMVVVQTNEATLNCPKARAADLKNLIKELNV